MITAFLECLLAVFSLIPAVWYIGYLTVIFILAKILNHYKL